MKATNKSSRSSLDKHQVSILIIFFCVILFLLIGYFIYNDIVADLRDPGPVIATSVSTDGDYVVTSHKDGTLILWSVPEHAYEVETRDSNPNSIYFIHNTHDFMYQDAITKMVYIKNINGRIIRSFPLHLSVYNNVINSGLTYYFAVGVDRSFYIRRGKQSLAKIATTEDFYKRPPRCHVEFHIARNDDVMISSGYCNYSQGVKAEEIKFSQAKAKIKPISAQKLGCINYWYLGKDGNAKVHAFFKDGGVTVSSLSPDGKYMVTGDEGGYIFATPVSVKTRNYIMEKPLVNILGYLSVDFVTNNVYIGSLVGNSSAVLGDVKNPNNYNIINLGDAPTASIDDYRYRSFASSAVAHIYVTGQAEGSGIIVYKYDPKARSLNRIWIGDLDTSY